MYSFTEKTSQNAIQDVLEGIPCIILAMEIRMSRLSNTTIETILSTFVELDEQGQPVKPDMPAKIATALQHEIHQAYRKKQKLMQGLMRRTAPITPSV